MCVGSGGAVDRPFGAKGSGLPKQNSRRLSRSMTWQEEHANLEIQANAEQEAKKPAPELQHAKGRKQAPRGSEKYIIHCKTCAA